MVRFLIRWFEKHTTITWTITIIGATLIYYISSLQFPPSTDYGGIGGQAIIYHFSAFFLLSLFLLMALVARHNTRLFILGITITIIYAILDETHQFFVPGRYFSYIDILINIIGAVCAGLLYLFLMREA